jgi:3-deoxy-D-manno-octulosonate 8-phosphate phosphatase (KDO 8-P phosphatase)
MISSADFNKITTLIFDIDGTLSDGRAGYMVDGQTVKFFDHHDMHWIKLALRSGLKVAIISGGDDFAGRHLADILNISWAAFGVKDKLAAFEKLLHDENISADECLYLGDDVVDMPVIRRAGIGAAVADAVAELDECADFRTTAPGGRGAAKEVITLVLKAKGFYDTIMERYRR